jgi:hypothetical protein
MTGGNTMDKAVLKTNALEKDRKVNKKKTKTDDGTDTCGCYIF